MNTRKEWWMDKAGSLNRLKLRAQNLQDPEKREIQVSIKAIGLNFADIFCVHGLYKAAPKTNLIPGLEFSGVVESVGEYSSLFQPGDRVFGVTKFGAYTDRLNLDERYFLPVPEDWSFQEAASFPVQALTAYYSLHRLGNLQPGYTVLIHSAAGGVGLWANRIAKKIGAFTIGTVGSPGKLELLEKEGYDKGIVRGKDFPEQLRESLEGRELNLILECIGGKIFRQGYEILAPMGRVIYYGSASFTSHSARPNYLKLFWKYLNRPRLDPMNMTVDNKGVLAFNLIWLYERVETMHELMQEIEALNLPRPMIGHTFPFDQMIGALKLFSSGKTMGKVVMEV